MYFGYVYTVVRMHENTSVMGFVVENRTKWGLNRRIGKCDQKNIRLMMG